MKHEIDYFKLLSEYDTSILTQLRSHRASVEFLDTWVPDENSAKSLLNLFEAAEIAGEESVAVRVPKSMLSDMDLQDLRKWTSGMGALSVETKGQDLLLVLNVKKSASQESAEVKAQLPIHPAYRTKLNRFLEKTDHRGNLDEKPGLMRLSTIFRGVRFAFLVDPRTGLLTTARYIPSDDKVRNDESRMMAGLLEAFCADIGGKPIQEVAEHGLIRLENSLRDRVEGLKPGIILIANTDPVFAEIQTGVRKLFAEYCEKTGESPKWNDYHHTPGEKWNRLEEKARIWLLQSEFDRALRSWGLSPNDFKAVAIQGAARGICTANEKFTAGEKARLLMKLEKWARDEIDPCIDLYMEEHKDQNEKRRL